jgi:hypothetical protein
VPKHNLRHEAIAEAFHDLDRDDDYRDFLDRLNADLNRDDPRLDPECRSSAWGGNDAFADREGR